MGTSDSKRVTLNYEQKYSSFPPSTSTTAFEQIDLIYHPKRLASKLVSPKQKALLTLLEKGAALTEEKKALDLLHVARGLKAFVQVLEGTKITSTDQEEQEAVCAYAIEYGCEEYFPALFAKK